jgi:CRP/FNR family transcriptional regulator, anaerobic regulatory protein
LLFPAEHHKFGLCAMLSARTVFLSDFDANETKAALLRIYLNAHSLPPCCHLRFIKLYEYKFMQPNPRQSSSHCRPSGARERHQAKPQAMPVDLQYVPAGRALFQAGDERQVFRVESGAVSHFMRWSDGRHEVIEFAFPGDLIGLGHLGKHVSSAHAMVDTMVSMISADELTREYASNGLLSLKLADAGEREFDYLRDQTVHYTKGKPVERMAQYLSALVRINEGNGQATGFISDMNCSPFIAEMLNMDAGTMGAALLHLQKQGLIAPSNGGLRIMNVEALERFVDAA